MKESSDIPIISVIVPSHRREYLEEAINSVLNQNLPRRYYEIIVVKDYLDEHLDSFLKSNSVISYYLNDDKLFPKIKMAIENSKGKLLCFLDDDDKFISSKLSYIKDCFSNKPEMVYLHNNFIPVDENNQNVNFKNVDYDFNSSCMSVRRNIINFEKIENLGAMIDPFYYLSAVESGGKIFISDKKLTIYRVHNSVTNSTNSQFEDIKKRRLMFYGKASESLMIFKSKFTNRKSQRVIRAMEIQLDINRYFLNYPTRYSINLRKFLRDAPRPFQKRLIVCAQFMTSKFFEMLGLDLRERAIKSQISSNYKLNK